MSAPVLNLEPLSPVGDALAGSLGAVFANAVVYPLDIIKTRIQVQKRKVSQDGTQDGGTGTIDGEHYTSALDALEKMVKQEGISGLYAGIAGGLFGTASQNFAYFYWYTFVRDAYTARVPIISTSMELVLGAVAGALSTIFTIPISVCTTRQQTASKSRRRNLWGTVQEVIGEDGITGLWRGLRPSLVLCVNPAITYGLFQILKKRIVGEAKLTPGQAFVVGALSKTVATVVTYPYIMAKVRMQHKDEDPTVAHAQKSLSAIGILTKIVQENGLLGLYKGMDTQISKAVLTQAILFYFRELFTKYTMVAFALLRQARARRALGRIAGDL
ncbi:putative Peroxisomal carrier protein [Taphrina deformans PYCC 5710]|uniref:Peroxisomal carrier protein n=1 Tax=Taphrina deformans (strain PYCC 5710 / ATCC 11124 / CBS 356.35 / IMI 108563 / JCM 9778 / NBRC 8474) TaxID=1097556 RepID=R4X9Y4_TAPDE|nr:putative Peroxisomal carrier protein [Taphrina deformans PYCC 5710]|eukprot:CCG82322.1 putative Peroxisomal carrier protein [Taphrina deformans PYCC 5710]